MNLIRTSAYIRPATILVVVVSALGLVRVLPREEDFVSVLNPSFVAIKVVVALCALFPAVIGYGLIAFKALSKLVQRFSLHGFETPDHRPRWMQDTLYIVSCGLVGVLLVGLLIFVIGLFASPGFFTSLMIYGIGLLSFATSISPVGDAVGRCSGSSVDYLQQPKPALERVSLVILTVVVILNLGQCLVFHTHGDPYSYNLSATDRWLRVGHTGVLLQDIHTGYALTTEHFYLWLRTLVGGHAEQYFLGTAYHFLLGFGTLVFCSLYLVGPFLSRSLRVLLVLFLFQGSFTYYGLQPRNDLFVTAYVVLTFCGLIAFQARYVLAGSLGIFAVKPSGPVAYLAALACAAVLSRCWAGARRGATIKLLAIAMTILILCWLPFGINNVIKTGNPTFPILNQLFSSPYAPTGFQDVIDDMAPGSLTLVGYLSGCGRMIAGHGVYLLASLLAITLIAGRFRARSDQGPDKRTRFDKGDDKRMAEPSGGYVLTASILFFALSAAAAQWATREYTPDLASRWVLPSLWALAMASFLILERVSGSLPMKARVVFGWLVFALCCTQLKVEVLARDAVQFLGRSNQTLDIKNRQPLLAVTDFLDDLLKRRGEVGARVLSVDRNLSFFLESGEFWHETKTYPAWQWPVERFSPGDWQARLQEHKISYVIAGPSDPKVKDTIMHVPHQVLFRSNDYVLMKVSL